MKRQWTESEIETDQHQELDRQGTLEVGRHRILNDRRRRRRHVWKDAPLHDIICLVSSPCVKPILPQHGHGIGLHLRQLTQSNENSSRRNPSILTTSSSDPHLIGSKPSIGAVANAVVFDSFGDEYEDDILCSVEDEKPKKSQKRHQPYSSNSWTLNSDVINMANSAKKQNKKKKNNKKKTGKKKGKKKKGKTSTSSKNVTLPTKSKKTPQKQTKGKKILNQNKPRQLVNNRGNPDMVYKKSYWVNNAKITSQYTQEHEIGTPSFTSHDENESKQYGMSLIYLHSIFNMSIDNKYTSTKNHKTMTTASFVKSDSELLKSRHKETFKGRNSDNSIDKLAPTTSLHGAMGDSMDSATSDEEKYQNHDFCNNKLQYLQHFDLKGMQTLLYDGILCSIHQTSRFLTLQGNQTNVLKNIRGCKLLHYIGYACNGKLLLESDDCVGLGVWIDPKNKKIIDKMTQCVVIQSPTHIECAKIFLDLKVKHVIAIKQPSDNFAHHITDFLTQFYFALIESNTTIARAFRTGLKLFEEDEQFAKTIMQDFKLLPETDDHELILFRNRLFRDGKPKNHSHKLPPHNNLHAIRPFIGRWNDVYRVMNMIRAKKLSTICSSEEETGRRSIITMAARYLWERAQFKGGVFHIKNNFKHRKFKDLAELILHTLSNAGVDGYQQIASFYKKQGLKWPSKTQLAVELLDRYVRRNNDNYPICLIFSDFDKMPFPAAAKFSFLCAFIDKFDTEIENPGDTGTRVVITCNLAWVGSLHYFMDNSYKMQSFDHIANTKGITSHSTQSYSPPQNSTQNYSNYLGATLDSPDSDGIIEHSSTAPFGVAPSVKYQVVDGTDNLNGMYFLLVSLVHLALKFSIDSDC